jgi:hypothetical protein
VAADGFEPSSDNRQHLIADLDRLDLLHVRSTREIHERISIDKPPPLGVKHPTNLLKIIALAPKRRWCA